MSTYEQAKARQLELEAQLKRTSGELRSVPGVGSGAMGLTPDAVKRSAPYQAAKRAYDSAFAALRSFNGDYVRRYRREIAADRRARLMTS